METAIRSRSSRMRIKESRIGLRHCRLRSVQAGKAIRFDCRHQHFAPTRSSDGTDMVPVHLARTPRVQENRQVRPVEYDPAVIELDLTKLTEFVVADGITRRHSSPEPPHGSRSDFGLDSGKRVRSQRRTERTRCALTDQ